MQTKKHHLHIGGDFFIGYGHRYYSDATKRIKIEIDG